MQNVANNSYRSVLAQLRGGTYFATDARVIGRYRRPKVPHSERTCTICSDEVEDERS